MRTLTRESDSGKGGKRNRPPTSCEPCRIRKLKCNRGSPCDACVKRSKQSSCEYAGNAIRDKKKHRNTSDRLKNLEHIVLQFVQNGITEKVQDQVTDNAINSSESMGHSGGSTTTGINPPSDERGTLQVREGQMNYLDSSHWLSILHDIKEIQEELALSNAQAQEDGEDQSVDDSLVQPEVDLIFGPLQPPTISEMLRSLPPRHVCDSLLSQFFNTKYMILPIVHPLQFQREYEQFWEDSSKSSTLWVGLLFAILGLTMTLCQITKMPLPIDSDGQVFSPEMFRLRTTQCLVLGKYSTAKAYGLEILVLHIQSTYLGLVDSNINLWFLLGIIIRLAMRMGYHRDSRIHPGFSPFEGEMRRRLWAVIYQLDVLMSFQLGLPSMIPSDYCDTEPPRNLTFSDFSPDTAVLPPGRPLSDHTSVLFTIGKGRLMGVFKKIVAHTQSLSPPPLETTIILELEMRETYNNLPSNLQMTPVSRSFMDTSSVIMERCCLELLHLKGIVVLYRRFLDRDTSNPKYAKFRRICLDAALDILSRQAELYHASQPGGQLHADQWMVSSLTAHDFLLAAMVVCLELSMHMRTPTATPRNAEFTRQFDALQTSHIIWKSRNPESKEARTAAQALELMIRTVKADSSVVNKSSSSTLLPHPTDLPFEDGNLSYAKPVSEMIDGSENLNWTLLDQYFQGTEGLQGFPSPLDVYSEEQDRDLFPSMEPDWTL